MEFSEILAAAYDDLGYQSSPATDVVTRIKRYVNEGLQAVLAEPALFGLIEADTPYTFASVASQAQYSIPAGHAYVRQIRDLTNRRTLSALTLDAYRRLDADPSTVTGTPSHWVPVGHVPVAVQPSDASAIYVKSSSASDTGSLYLSGLITGGYRQSETITMTGTTAAASALSTYLEITDVYMSAAAVGTVTILEDSGSGTELARIAIGQKRPNYQGFYLWPTPAGANTYSVDTRREFESLVNTTDEPPLPRDAHPMLIAYATYREWQRKDDSRAGISKAQYDQWLSRLKYRLAQSGDAMPIASVGREVGVSRLGGFYPADTVVR